MRRKITAGKVGSAYPWTRRVYFKCLVRRVKSYRKLRSLNAPSVIVDTARTMVMRAVIGVVLPPVENLLRRREEQTFFDGLCREVDGWAWCKLTVNHGGECEVDWCAAADRLIGPDG